MKTIICSFILFFNMIGYVCADASLWSINDDFIENNQLDEGNTYYSSNIDLHAELKVEPIFNCVKAIKDNFQIIPSVLRDIPACQHVLRILTGISG